MISSKKKFPCVGPPELPPCKVCGDQGTGCHYGVTTCIACKGFFQRSLTRDKPYDCLTGRGDCLLGPDSKRKRICPKCRLDRCYAVGMSKEAIKIGRYSYEKKTKDAVEIMQTKMTVPGVNGQRHRGPRNRMSSRRSLLDFDKNFRTPVTTISEPRDPEGWVMVGGTREDNPLSYYTPHPMPNPCHERLSHALTNLSLHGVVDKQLYCPDFQNTSQYINVHDNLEQCPEAMWELEGKHPDSMSQDFELDGDLQEPTFMSLAPNCGRSKMIEDLTSASCKSKDETSISTMELRKLPHLLSKNVYLPAMSYTKVSDDLKVALKKKIASNKRITNEAQHQLSITDMSNETEHTIETTTVVSDNIQHEHVYNSNINNNICSSNDNGEVYYQSETVEGKPYSSPLRPSELFFSCARTQMSDGAQVSRLLKQAPYSQSRLDATGSIYRQAGSGHLPPTSSPPNKYSGDNFLDTSHLSERETLKSHVDLYAVASRHGESLYSVRNAASEIVDENDSLHQLDVSVSPLCESSQSTSPYSSGSDQDSSDGTSSSSPMIQSKPGSPTEPLHPVRHEETAVDTISPTEMFQRLYNGGVFDDHAKHVMKSISSCEIVSYEIALLRPLIETVSGIKMSMPTSKGVTNSPDIRDSLKKLSEQWAQTQKSAILYSPVSWCEFSEKELEDVISIVMRAHQLTIGDDLNTCSPEELKRKEVLFQSICEVKRFVFGETWMCESDVYFDFLENTGLDIDRRKELLDMLAPVYEGYIYRVVRFLKYLPGYKSLSMEDKTCLAKSAVAYCHTLGSFRGINANQCTYIDECNVARNALKFSMSSKVAEEVLHKLFRLGIVLQGLGLSLEEIVLLKAILSVHPSSGAIQDYVLVAKVHRRLMCALQLSLKRNRTCPDQTLADIVDIVQTMIALRKDCQRNLTTKCSKMLSLLAYTRHPLLGEFVVPNNWYDHPF